jgi:hypothetical protein
MRIARAIEREVADRGHEVELKEVGEVAVEGLNDYDLVFLGAACHDSDLAQPAKQFLNAIASASAIADAPSFKLAGFVTHATRMPEQGERWQALYERWAGACLPTFQRTCEQKQIPLLGFFHCQGAPSAPIEAFIHNTIVTDEREWAVYSAEARTHPDSDDLANARAFARQTLNAM